MRFFGLCFNEATVYQKRPAIAVESESGRHFLGQWGHPTLLGQLQFGFALFRIQGSFLTFHFTGIFHGIPFGFIGQFGRIKTRLVGRTKGIGLTLLSMYGDEKNAQEEQ